MIKRILRAIRRKMTPKVYHDMRTHPAERHYFDLYWSHISPLLSPSMDTIDIGAQNGRFTFPMAERVKSVLATDVHAPFLENICSNMANHSNITLAEENLDQTLGRAESFDLALCLEVLYTLKDLPNLIKRCNNIIEPSGYLIASHRTIGYYAYRYLGAQNYGELDQVLSGTHPAFEGHDPDTLTAYYAQAGFKVVKCEPIGLFSGFGQDAFTPIIDAAHAANDQLEKLKFYEQNDRLKQLLINNARYLLIIAQKPAE